MVAHGSSLGDLQQHLQTMFTLLRSEDTIRLVTTIIQTITIKPQLADESRKM